ncbi:MAG: SWIM zinc finger family protein [Microlunatus sp.]|nr:SWIM zinc finger family protein [Microlunatus sp.]
MVADIRPDQADRVIDLAPSHGTERAVGQRLLFDGFLNHPVQAAAALLLLGRVARHRFYLPAGMVAAKIASSDPVVTTCQDQLRFESFSACCGMALRYDVLSGGLATRPNTHGSTNIDLTEPTRIALTGIQGLDPLHLRITNEIRHAVTFTTLDHTVTEAKAPLPQRWVRGFAEAQAAGAGLVQHAEISSGQARRFWRTLPRADNGSAQLYVATNGRGLHLTGSATATTIPLGGPSRLRIIEPLLKHAHSITVYGSRHGLGPGVSLWQLNFPDGILSCALSATPSRGFSGEGGLLHQLADPDGIRHADHIGDYLTDHHNGELLTVAGLTRLGLTNAQVETGLARLAAAGIVGYDAAQRGYFHRELPWAIDAAQALNPRLVAANTLVTNATITSSPTDDIIDIRHGASHHRVRGRGPNATCTCPWIGQHGTSRGPCKHILAADIVRNQQGWNRRPP